MTTITTTCKNSLCGKEFEYIKKNKERFYCCVKCGRDEANRNNQRKRAAEQLEKYGEIPTCKLCGYRGLSLTNHLLHKHKLSTTEYMEHYNATTSDIYHSSYLNKCSERFSGKNNPAYNHGGKLSPYSDKFIKYESLTEDEISNKVSKLANGAAKTRKDNHNESTSVEFYIKWFNVDYDEAIRMLSERQSTFSLDICIEKYGETIGYEIWRDRQDKWQETLFSKSEEDITDFNKRKGTIGGTSKPAEELFDLIYETYADGEREFLHYKSDKNNKRERIIRLNDGRFVRPDFLDEPNKIVIEFYGDYWHANPEKFDESFYNKKTYQTYADIHSRDDDRESRIKDSGWNMYIVWEQSYKTDKDATIELILKFIESCKKTV